MKKTFIGVFQSKDQLFSKIKELQRKGIENKNIYIVARDNLIVEELKSQTSQEIRNSPSSMINRFFGFISGEDNVHSMLADVGFSKEVADSYYEQVMNGAMLIYIEGKPVDDPPMASLVIDESRYGGYDPLSSEEIKTSRIENN